MLAGREEEMVREIIGMHVCGIDTAMKQRLDELEEFLDEQQEPVTDYDEGMVRRLIERITVYEDHLDFEFKSGLETEVQM